MLIKVKDHVVKHKDVYLIAGIAGISCLIMRGRIGPLALRGGSTIVGNTTLEIRPLAFFAKQTVIVLVREGRGHPGYLTKCVETGEIFLTQGEATRFANTYASAMSKHLAGHIPEINGYHFERVLAILV